MHRPRPLPDRLNQKAAFDRATASDERVGPGRLRSKDLHRPYHGVQSLRIPTTVLERCAVYAVRMRPSDSFSHVTAALLHGLPVPRPLSGRTALDVAAVHPAAAPSTRGVIGHRLRTEPPVVLLHGLRVCEQIEVWCQLAGLLDLADLVAVADHLLSTAADPAVMRERMRVAVRAPGRYRTASLTRALHLARAGSRSPQESRLRIHLVTAGLPEPELNAPVLGEEGRVLGHGDLVWRSARVVGEYEGDQHRSDVRQWRYDIRRYDAFAAAGWTTIRVAADSMTPMNRAALVERFAGALRAG